MAAANRFVNEMKFEGEVLCDSMANDVLLRYNSHPERICICLNGNLVHIGGKGPLVFYDIEGVISWLDNRFGYDPMAPDDVVNGTKSAGSAPVSEPEEECSA